MRFTCAWSVLVLVGCWLPACGDDDASDNGAVAGAGTSRAGSGNESPVETHEVTCTDQSVSQLRLFGDPNGATVEDESREGGVFHTFIDATGGATGGILEASKSFVYGRFTDDGFEPVRISDEEAFTSTDWDIAVRRYVFRLNSGVSGPSHVTGARTRPDTEFESLSDVPDDVEYRTEQYFTESCEYVNDGSGINSPGTALASFWSYQMCLSMTHYTYVLALANGRHVKLEVLNYYTPENQQACDETGRVPSPSGAGNIRFRWAFLD